MKKTTIAFLLLLGTTMTSPALITESITISPANPKPPAWPVTLAANASAQLTVIVDPNGTVNGVAYGLKSGPSADIDGTSSVLWTGSMNGNSGIFTVVNSLSGSQTQTTTVKVSCVWSPTSGSGGGSGAPPPDIHGLAEGDATLNPGSHVSWWFDRTIQCVGGSITWHVEVDDANGNPDPSVTSISVSVVNKDPSSATWTLTSNADGNPRSGTATSSDPSTANQKATWSGGSDTSETSLTFLKIDSINASSPVAGLSLNPPPFEGQDTWPFEVTKSPHPDKHLVVFYKDVIDSSFNVQDFDVTLTANVLPNSVGHEMLNEVWMKISGPSSGSFDRTDTFQVKYRNPKRGGVYRFLFDPLIGNCAKSEANFVLPLAGAEVDSIIKADIGRANTFAATVVSSYSWLARQNPQNGLRWFYYSGHGDYLGRADSKSMPTVWAYNQIDVNGMGAIVTWKGKPVRVSKISNFMVAYAAHKIGVNPVFSWMSQVIGTFNDSAASKSWDAGWSVAGGNSYDTNVEALVADIWNEADEKNQKLWPNTASCSNYATPSSLTNFNLQFTSPGFLYMSNP